MGKLLAVAGEVGTYYLGVSRSARECVPRDEYGCDTVLWKHSEDNYKTHFSSSKTWDQVRERRDKVGWSKSVWFPQEVARYSFIVWLAVKNRLSTGDRMRAWGIQQGCVMCEERDETRDHVFFACPYAFTVWDKLAGRLCDGNIDPDCSITLQFVTSNTLRIMDKILIKMVFQTCIYICGRREMTDAIRKVSAVWINQLSSVQGRSQVC
ncbi:hypothetical protein F2Q70_00002983 [Brassica cretica]|nr:hypothetical protein F2Q70_00002983 [Brassica cretica]